MSKWFDTASSTEESQLPGSRVTRQVAASHNGMTGRDSRSWVMLRIGKTSSTEPQAKEPVDEKNKICWPGCPCRDDCGGGCRQDGEVRLLGVIPNRVESIRKSVRKLGPVEQLQFCYEAGPTGSSWSEPRLYWKAPCDSRSFSRSSLERLSNRLAVTVLEVLETGDPIRKQLKWKATRLGLRLVQAHA